LNAQSGNVILAFWPSLAAVAFSPASLACWIFPAV
jgi:hypothetical protein